MLAHAPRGMLAASGELIRRTYMPDSCVCWLASWSSRRFRPSLNPLRLAISLTQTRHRKHAHITARVHTLYSIYRPTVCHAVGLQPYSLWAELHYLDLLCVDLQTQQFDRSSINRRNEVQAQRRRQRGGLPRCRKIAPLGDCVGRSITCPSYAQGPTLLKRSYLTRTTMKQTNFPTGFTNRIQTFKKVILIAKVQVISVSSEKS